jgi:hypothetical protein
MKRFVITCDICGKDISHDWFYKLRGWKYLGVGHHNVYPVHTCEKCMRDFEKYVKAVRENER